MKTAEEWLNYCISLQNREAIEQIQLDAMREGYKRAAKLPAEMVIGGRAWTPEQKIAGDALLECQSAILTAAEQLTIDDL